VRAKIVVVIQRIPFRDRDNADDVPHFLITLMAI